MRSSFYLTSRRGDEADLSVTYREYAGFDFIGRMLLHTARLSVPTPVHMCRLRARAMPPSHTRRADDAGRR